MFDLDEYIHIISRFLLLIQPHLSFNGNIKKSLFIYVLTLHSCSRNMLFELLNQ